MAAADAVELDATDVHALEVELLRVQADYMSARDPRDAGYYRVLHHFYVAAMASNAPSPTRRRASKRAAAKAAVA